MDKVDLHGIQLIMRSADASLREAWHYQFAGWRGDARQMGSGHIELAFRLVAQMPELPQHQPIYADGIPTDDRANQLAVWQQAEGQFVIYFAGMGLVEIDVVKAAVKGVVRRQAVRTGRFADILFTSLAPILRRQQIFMIHAFGLQQGNERQLLIGPNGSGKSSWGLHQVLDQNHRFLGNDVMLVKAEKEGVFCWPSPGEVAVRPEALLIYPEFSEWCLPSELAQGAQQRVDGARIREQFGGTSGLVNNVTVLSRHEEPLAFQELSPTIALGQLMTGSVDRWDGALFAEHLAVLRLIVEQASTHQLLLEATSS